MLVVKWCTCVTTLLHLYIAATSDLLRLYAERLYQQLNIFLPLFTLMIAVQCVTPSLISYLSRAASQYML